MRITYGFAIVFSFGVIGALISVVMIAWASSGDIKGDINCDGSVNPIDSLFLLRYDAGLTVNLPPGCDAIGGAAASAFSGGSRGDINCDGSVNPIDSLFLLRHDAGLTVNMPVGCDAIGSSAGTATPQQTLPPKPSFTASPTATEPPSTPTQPPSTPTTTPTATPTVTSTPTATPTVGAVTQTPTSTPSPTPTPTPMPGSYSFNMSSFYSDPDQFQATVTSINLVQNIPGSGFYDSVAAPAGADFAVVLLSVKNFGTTPDYVGSYSFRLKRTDGRIYTIDFQDDLTINSTAQSHYTRMGLYDTIQPGVTAQSVFVFLVPNGSSLTAERCPTSGCDTTAFVGSPPGGCSFTMPSFYTDSDQFCAQNVSISLVNVIPGSGFYDAVTAPAGTDYAVIQFSSSNFGYHPGYIGSYSFRLRDSLNRLFTIDFANDLTVNSTAQSYHSRRGLYDTIQPGLTDLMVFVFLVPDGTVGLSAESCPNSGCD
jgi:hypothetical protein